MSVEVGRFGRWLARATGLPVVYHDERSSSREAARLLAGSGLTRSRKRARSDAVAAQVVLQSWLESAAGSGHPAAAAQADDPGAARHDA